MTKAFCALVTLSGVLLAVPGTTAGDTKTIVGRLTDIQPESRLARTDDDSEVLVVRTKRGDEVAVTVGTRTRYLKWVTRQPWQQDRRASAAALHVGTLVSIDLGGDGERPLARVVRIATD